MYNSALCFHQFEKDGMVKPDQFHLPPACLKMELEDVVAELSSSHTDCVNGTDEERTHQWKGCSMDFEGIDFVG